MMKEMNRCMCSVFLGHESFLRTRQKPQDKINDERMNSSGQANYVSQRETTIHDLLLT